MPEHSKTWLNDSTLRVMTYKSGSFTFGVQEDVARVQATIDRINDAQHRFNKMHGLPQIIDQMQQKVMVSSVYSTNTIEGGEYTEAETEQILTTDPAHIQKSEEKRLTNLKQAIDWVKQQGTTELIPNQGKPLTMHAVMTLHKLVSQHVDEKNNPPQQFRNNQPTQKTLVGHAEHGGTYRPPKCIEDIEYLMLAWLEWLNSPALLAHSALIRAHLAHYYFELIHPFWDGNGRTGRLIEMLILEQSGYRFSASAVWKYYQQNIHQYFSLFNHCRKLAEHKQPFANDAFIDFTTNAMLQTINDLHDQGNTIIAMLLYKHTLNDARDKANLSERQYRLIEVCLTESEWLSAAELYKKPLVQALFTGRTERTYYRDIEKVVKLGFLMEQNGKLWANWR